MTTPDIPVKRGRGRPPGTRNPPKPPRWRPAAPAGSLWRLDAVETFDAWRKAQLFNANGQASRALGQLRRLTSRPSPGEWEW